jgi:hypothetical protein
MSYAALTHPLANDGAGTAARSAATTSESGADRLLVQRFSEDRDWFRRDWLSPPRALVENE